MAHILVYLQRTPQGLHPASAVALCWARDLGSTRGATVTAVAYGDAGPLDRATLRAAGRFGADGVFFCGPRGLVKLQERLQPVHVMVPWTREGLAVSREVVGGPAVPRWVQQRQPPFGGADAVTGVVAGTLPWYDFALELDGEYEESIGEAAPPPWAAGLPGTVDFSVLAAGPLGFLGTGSIDPASMRVLRELRADPVDLATVSRATAGTYLLFEPGAGPMPAAFADRDPHVRVILLPGSAAAVDHTWIGADWAWGGAWQSALELLGRAARPQ